MVNVKLKSRLVILSFMVFAFGAYAENGTVWDLDNLQKQRVLYEAKAALNKAKAEAESAGSGAGVALAPVSSGNGAVPITTVSLPQLIKINGRNAVISLPDGNTTTISSGQMLPGGKWQVMNIGLGGVKIKNIATQQTQILN